MPGLQITENSVPSPKNFAIYWLTAILGEERAKVAGLFGSNVNAIDYHLKRYRMIARNMPEAQLAGRIALMSTLPQVIKAHNDIVTGRNLKKVTEKTFDKDGNLASSRTKYVQKYATEYITNYLKGLKIYFPEVTEDDLSNMSPLQLKRRMLDALARIPVTQAEVVDFERVEKTETGSEEAANKEQQDPTTTVEHDTKLPDERSQE